MVFRSAADRGGGARYGMPETRRLPASDTQAVLRRNRSLRALATAIVVGGSAAAVMLLPGVTVDPEGPLDPSSPHPISFEIADFEFNSAP